MSDEGQPTLRQVAEEALEGADIPGNRAAVKGAGLGAHEIGLYWTIVQAFPELGGPPDPAWVQQRAAALGVDAEAVLAEFAARDLIQRDPASGAIIAAYPFSGVSTLHQVVLAGGKPVYAMCAIDALGIPCMFERDAIISSNDPTDGTPIRIAVTDGSVQWEPADAVVLVGSTGEPGSAAESRCPVVNFFASPTAADAFLSSHPSVSGRVLARDAALEAAKRVFGTAGIVAAYVAGEDACAECR